MDGKKESDVTDVLSGKYVRRPTTVGRRSSRSQTSDYSAQSSQPLAHDTNKRIRRYHRKQLFVLLAVCIFLALLTGIGGFIISRNSSHSKYPSAVEDARKRLGFPIYYPIKLPDGFNAEIGDTSIADGVLLYNLKYDNGKELSVSEQLKPDNLDFNTILGLPHTSPTLIVRAGQATYINEGSRTIASILSDKTWLIVNASKGLDEGRLKELLESFRLVN